MSERYSQVADNRRPARSRQGAFRKALLEAERVRSRGRNCSPFPGGFGHQPPASMAGRAVRTGLGQVGVGNAHLANAGF